MFSTAYKSPLRHFHSISFQNYGAGRFASSGMLAWCLKWLASRFAVVHGGAYEAIPAGLDSRFLPKLFETMLPVGRSEDRAMQGCNPSAAPEAGLVGAWKHVPPPSVCRISLPPLLSASREPTISPAQSAKSRRPQALDGLRSPARVYSPRPGVPLEGE